MTRRPVVIAAAAIAAVAGYAGVVLAQGMPGHRMPGGQMMQGPMPHGAPTAEAARSPSTAGFIAAMDKMMRDTPAMTGNTDRDFAAGMIPHHQAAIDMARVQLQHGRDPGMRKMAEEIIAAQEREIAELKAFLAK